MNKLSNFFRLLCLASVLCLGVACDEEQPVVVEPTPTVQATSWAFSGESSTYSFQLEAENTNGCVLQLSDTVKWLSADYDEMEDGVMNITLLLEKNESSAERFTQIKVVDAQSKALVQHIGVKQYAFVKTIQVNTSQEEWEIPAEGATVEFEVSANVAIEVEKTAWVQEVETPEEPATKATNTTTHIFHIEANPHATARTASIVVKSADGQPQSTISLNQKPTIPVEEEPVLEVVLDGSVDNKLTMPAGGGYITGTVKSNVNFECLLSEWTYQQKSGYASELNETQLTIYVEPNMQADRVAYLQVTYEGLETPINIEVNQPAYTFNLTTEQQFPANGGTIDVQFDVPQGTDIEMVSGAFLVGEVDADGKAQMVFNDKQIYSSTRVIQTVVKYTLNKKSTIASYPLVQQGAEMIKLMYDGQPHVGDLQVEAAGTTTGAYTVVLPFEGAEWNAVSTEMKSPNPQEPAVEMPCDWITVQKQGDQLVLVVEANPVTEERIGTVCVYVAGFKDINECNINVIQAEMVKEYDFTVGANALIDHAAGAYEPTFITDISQEDATFEFEVTSGSEWISEVTLSDYNALVVTATANEMEQERTAKVNVHMVADGERRVTKEVTITQKAKPEESQKIEVRVDQDQVPFEGMGRPARIQVLNPKPGIKYNLMTVSNLTAPQWYVEASNVDGTIQFFRNERAYPGPVEVYIYPADEAFDPAKLDSYGKATVVLLE